MLHVALDKYGFFAVTTTLTTLRAIIALVEEQNRIWQEKFDEGRLYIRDFDVGLPIFDSYTTSDMFTQLLRSPFSDAQYELVVLHPEHFLPKGSSLSFYHRNNDQHYVVGYDRTLRESPGTADSPRFPTFTFDTNRTQSLPLNVFLVLLNAEIKFRRYRRMEAMPKLPEDVEKLMDETLKLVDLIYWRPEKRSEYHRRADKACPMDIDVQDVQDIEMGMRPIDEEDDEDTLGKSSRRTQAVRRPGENATLEQRREYMQYLLSGRGGSVFNVITVYDLMALWDRF